MKLQHPSSARLSDEQSIQLLACCQPQTANSQTEVSLGLQPVARPRMSVVCLCGHDLFAERGTVTECAATGQYHGCSVQSNFLMEPFRYPGFRSRTAHPTPIAQDLFRPMRGVTHIPDSATQSSNTCPKSCLLVWSTCIGNSIGSLESRAVQSQSSPDLDRLWLIYWAPLSSSLSLSVTY